MNLRGANEENVNVRRRCTYTHELTVSGFLVKRNRSVATWIQVTTSLNKQPSVIYRCLSAFSKLRKARTGARLNTDTQSTMNKLTCNATRIDQSNEIRETLYFPRRSFHIPVRFGGKKLRNTTFYLAPIFFNRHHRDLWIELPKKFPLDNAKNHIFSLEIGIEEFVSCF